MRLHILQNPGKVRDILFLLIREPHLEAPIVELHQFDQIAGRTIGELGSAGGEAAELLHHTGAGIRAFSGDEGAAGILSEKAPAQLRVRGRRSFAGDAE